GFTAPIPNALDAVSDRSYVLDALHNCALLMIHLSRMCQELILWSTQEFGFVRLSDRVTTGSSIMPQKRNPDMAELIRGRAGRAIGNWTALAATLKALPLGYNRDTQDDKPPLFESLDLARDSLRLVSLMISEAEWDARKMAAAARQGFTVATDIADLLAEQGIPFREAHEIVGRMVRDCREKGRFTRESLNQHLAGLLTQEALAAAEKLLDARGSVRRRESEGGTGPQAMAQQLRHAAKLHRAVGFARLT
ncbi:MAG TPA: lyase family protein, partial [Fimbriimonadaceae bacterium]|nr:lyase family protein [Fimbriimonadaceae bacterium]